MAIVDKLKAIGDAIRYKTGKTELMNMDQMALEIRDLKSDNGLLADIFNKTISGDLILSTDIKKIPEYVLRDLNITSVSGEGVITIGSNSLIGCDSLTAVSFPNLKYINSTEEQTTFSSISTTISGQITDLSFPELIKFDGYFDCCESLKTFNAPKLQYISRAFYKCSQIEELNLPSLIYVGTPSYMLYNCNKLKRLSVPMWETAILDGQSTVSKNLEYLDISAVKVATQGEDFRYVGANAENFELIAPQLTEVGMGAFANSGISDLETQLPALANISGPTTMTTSNPGAFQECLKLTKISLPDFEILASGAFYKCSNISYVDLPNTVQLRTSSLGYIGTNSETIEFNIPNLVSINGSALVGVKGIVDTTKQFPKLAEVGSFGLSACPDLEIAAINDAPEDIVDCFVGYASFQGCPKLRKITIGKQDHIESSAFYNCSALDTVILKSDTIIPSNDSNIFTGTPIRDSETSGYIYVPAALVESYKSATNWTIYADKFRAIEDYPEITGGTTA